MNYRLFRSRRKTLGLEIKNGEIIVRAPQRLSKSEIDAFVYKHRKWIEKRLAKEKIADPLTSDEIQALAEKAKKVIPERVRFYAPKVGVTYGRITIRHQRTRWGSCSGKGNLNFNCLLMLTPPEVLDSVVVHELCHRKEMNHSKRFYDEVLRVFPEYKKWNKWLKDNGGSLIRRIPR